MQTTVKTQSGRLLIIPTDEEDAAITRAALSDPDAQPLTDAEWASAKPQWRRGRLPSNHIGSQKMNDKSVVPFSEIESGGLDLNQITDQAQKMIHMLRQMGIKEATFESGVYFSHDQREGTNTLATDGILVEQRTHTTSLTFRHEGSTEQQAITELESRGVTQKAQGAFSSGKSQAWVALEHAKNRSEES